MVIRVVSRSTIQDVDRVLVIAYYFPPMGLSGVQRIAKFVKYLPDYGWEPVVLTVDPGGYFAYDSSLLQEIEERGIEIHRTKSVDPTRLFGRKKVVTLPGERSRSRYSRLSQFMFVPDNKIGWKRHAIAAGRRLLDERKFRVIFSSAPPYTCHLIGSDLSDYGDIPMVTDFRDDWYGNPRHIYATPVHRRMHKRLETKIVRESAHVTTINRHIKDNLVSRNLGANGFHQVTVVPHGFDPEDFNRITPGEPTGRMRWVYSGVFYDVQQPDNFLKAFRMFLDRNSGFIGRMQLDFVGIVPEAARSLVERLDLSGVVTMHGYVCHSVALRHLHDADVLWMVIGRQKGEEMISTGKLYEYFGSRKPVLGLVPDGTARQALRDYGAGVAVDPDAIPEIAGAIEGLAERWATGRLPRPDESFVIQYDRKRLAEKLARILHAVQAHD